MSTGVETRSASAERVHHRTNLLHQAAVFVGLFLASIAGLIAAWLIHFWASGLHVHWWVINWDVNSYPAVMPLAVSLLTLATVGLAYLGWQFAAHREPWKRGALAGSVLVIGLFFAMNVGTGPSWFMGGLLVFSSWTVAVAWSLARLDVARNDKRTDGDGEDSLMKKWGISALTKFRPKVHYDPETGEPARVDIKVKHAPGETVAAFQDNMASMESAVGGPPGMSTATSDPDRADESNVSFMLRDPFKGNIEVGPPLNDGKSVAEYTSVGDYADGKPAFVTTAAGIHVPVSTSYGLIGATRAGKTGTETQLLTSWGGRCDWTCLYLNQAKGLQDIRPILPIIGAAVIAEDGDAGLGEYVVSFQQGRAIMIYRQQELARFAVSAWSPRCCDPNPDKRPSRLGSDGRRIVMERMPFLTIHVGEADAIMASNRAGDDAVYIASKGLSLGVNSGWSLQRPDWKAMPTALRSNIGLWFAHGMAEDDEDFVMPDWLRKAGAHPGRWGQKRPGQHYMFGVSVDDSRAPIAVKTRFRVGPEFNPDGSKVDFDTLNDRYMAEMLRRNLANASKMCLLDRGSAEATDGWWDEKVAATAELRDRMLKPQTANRGPQTVKVAARKVNPLAGEPADEPAVEDDEISPEEMEELRDEFTADVAETSEVDGIPLYEDGPEGRAARAMDLTRPFQPRETDVDPLADSDDDEDGKPKAESPEAARAELRRTVLRMIGEPKYAHPKVSGAAVFGPTEVFRECGLRSRPWTSAQLAEILISGGGAADGFLLERHGDLREGRYLARRTGSDDHRQ
jgi:hypothetical protein